jgi:two-component system, chemotaxis family, sensor kinase CheA
LKPTSLLHKFVRILLLVSLLIALPTLATVFYTSVETSARQLSVVRAQIEQSIASKGKVLTQNHALALRNLSLDNAFVDMQSLVESAVLRDDDLLYGIYVDAEGTTLAYTERGKPAEKGQAPKTDAWSRLGLSEKNVNVREEVVRHAHVLNKEVLEVAVPVAGEEEGDPALGTVRYGLSTQRMADALSNAQREAKTRLSRSLWLIGALIFAATVVGLLLSRHIAVRITQPVTELTAAANRLAGGDREVRVRVDSGDELAQLGASFNKMVNDLDASYRQLEEMNRTLEHKVQQRTDELQHRNRDMRLVLDNVDQGFITLDPRGVMAKEHSRVVDQWFGAGGEATLFWQYLTKTSKQFATEFEAGWGQIQEDVLPIDLCLAQLPATLSAGERSYSFSYLPLLNQERFEGCLIVIADVTEKLAREREDSAQHEQMVAFKRVVNDRTGFMIFMREAEEILAPLMAARSSTDLSLLKRSLHTLKGSSDSVGLRGIASLCHQLEDYIATEGMPPEAMLLALQERFSTLKQHVTSLFAQGRPNVVEVPEAEYATLLKQLAGNTNAPLARQLAEQLRAWQLEPLHRTFERFAELGRGLARRLGKGELKTTFDGGELAIDPERWGSFLSTLTHVVRNAVDHGIETQEERRAANKAEGGTLSFQARRQADKLVLEVTDDGRGVDWERIKKAAQARGLPNSSDTDLLNALCCEGLSTSANITSISGRGVGMAAVKRSVEDLGGIVQVRSKPGLGTSWLFTLPIQQAASVLTNRHGALSAQVS